MRTDRSFATWTIILAGLLVFAPAASGALKADSTPVSERGTTSEPETPTEDPEPEPEGPADDVWHPVIPVDFIDVGEGVTYDLSSGSLVYVDGNRSSLNFVRVMNVAP